MDFKKIPPNIIVERGQTQVGVNYQVLSYLYNHFNESEHFSALDLPCGYLEFIGYLKRMFPSATLSAGDINLAGAPDINFYQMDVTEKFPFPEEQQFDLITSISGVMMFSNTLSFIKNCSEHLKNDGTFILTNDNSATIKDRLAYLFLGRYRIFNLVFENNQPMTENVPIHELIRLMRTNNIEIENIEYTSLYKKDLLFLPFAAIAYLTQYLYLKSLKTKLPKILKWKMYPFKAMFCRHYIIYGNSLK